MNIQKFQKLEHYLYKGHLLDLNKRSVGQSNLSPEEKKDMIRQLEKKIYSRVI
jgi:hypothetical protein